MRKGAGAIGVVLAMLVGAVAVAHAGDDVEKQIRDLDRQWVEAVKANNLDWIANLYTKDGYFMPPGSPPIEGPEAIRKTWEGMLGAPNFVSLTFEPVEIGVSGSGDLAYDVGTSKFRTRNDDGDVVTQDGKYLVVWKKVDGEWKVKADIFNPNEVEP